MSVTAKLAVTVLAFTVLAPSCPATLRAVLLGELVALVAQRTIRADNLVVEIPELVFMPSHVRNYRADGGHKPRDLGPQRGIT